MDVDRKHCSSGREKWNAAQSVIIIYGIAARSDRMVGV